MVRWTGLEPANAGLKGQGFDHSAFHRTILAGTTGLEPAFSAFTVPRGLQLLHAPVPSAEVEITYSAALRAACRAQEAAERLMGIVILRSQQATKNL